MISGLNRGNVKKNFAVQNSVTFTVPAGEYWSVNGCYAHLASSATVGNRLLEFQILDSTGSIIWDTRSAYDQAAGGDQYAHAVPGGYHIADNNRQYTCQPLPLPCLLSPAMVFKVYDRANIDANDTLEVNLFYTQVN